MPALLHQVQIIAGKMQSEHPHRDEVDLDELRRLIKQGVEIEDSNDEGWTAYMWAILCGLHDVAKILKEAGADVSHCADAELVAASFDGDVELARKALNAGAKNNLKCGYWPALGLATYHGWPGVVAVMLARGIAVSHDALQPLGEMDITDWKIESDEKEQAYARLAEILIDHGASPNVIAYDGRPLIESFPVTHYPNIHRVLSDALKRSSDKP